MSETQTHEGGFEQNLQRAARLLERVQEPAARKR